MDGVDAAGRVVIAYWARLSLRELNVTWHALSEYDVEGGARRTSSLAPVPPPSRRGGRISWRSDALPVSLHMDVEDAPHERMLLETPNGIVHWRGETMAAEMHLVRAGQATFCGLGYCECLTLSLPPWTLPIDAVDWGHWIAADCSRSSTWFRWRGDHPLTLVVEDGRGLTHATVDGTRISPATALLDLSPARQLERRHLGEILTPIPLLSRVVPASLLRLEEAKWLGRGVRRDSDGTRREGWAVFEAVHLRPNATRGHDV